MGKDLENYTHALIGCKINLLPKSSFPPSLGFLVWQEGRSWLQLLGTAKEGLIFKGLASHLNTRLATQTTNS